MKKWIWILITVILAFLALVGFAFVRSMFTVVKYGTPHYRPQVN